MMIMVMVIDTMMKKGIEKYDTDQRKYDDNNANSKDE